MSLHRINSVFLQPRPQGVDGRGVFPLFDARESCAENVTEPWRINGYFWALCNPVCPGNNESRCRGIRSRLIHVITE
jgi:hypothetical protein